MTILIVATVGAVWLVFLFDRPLEAVIALAAAGGWWDYLRRRRKLNPR